MRVYLSGPMRGLPEHNFPTFNRAAARLRDAGYTVLNPAESPFEHRTQCLRHDIQLLLIVDAIVVLPGWQDSPGARFEVAEAWQIGIPVFTMGENFRGGLVLEPLKTCSVYLPREDQYLNQRPLLGLCGYAQAGKDEIAKTLVQLGWSRVAFADPLKKIATDIGWSGQKDEDGRRLLQNLGVAIREHLHSDAWVIAGEEAIEAAEGPVVVTDVRFPNEVQMVRRRAGMIVRVVRPGIEAANEHISEHAIAGVEPDAIFMNDGTLDEIPEKVLSFVNEHFNQTVGV